MHISEVGKDQYELFTLEVLVLHTGLIHLDSLYSNDPFSGSEEPGRSRRIREEEPGGGAVQKPNCARVAQPLTPHTRTPLR